MKNITWDYYKDQSLRQHRNISFEEILLLIAEGHLVDILENRNLNYRGQKIMLVNKDQYIYCVPYFADEKEIRLITIFPSRKLTRIYLEEVKEHMEPYDSYEKELIASLENNEWQSVEQAKTMRDQMQENARAELHKRTRINLRLPAKDLEAIKLKALEEGMPYQTLIASVLHRYVNGKL